MLASSSKHGLEKAGHHDVNLVLVGGAATEGAKDPRRLDGPVGGRRAEELAEVAPCTGEPFRPLGGVRRGPLPNIRLGVPQRTAERRDVERVGEILLGLPGHCGAFVAREDLLRDVENGLSETNLARRGHVDPRRRVDGDGDGVEHEEVEVSKGLGRKAFLDVHDFRGVAAKRTEELLVHGCLPLGVVSLVLKDLRTALLSESGDFERTESLCLSNLQAASPRVGSLGGVLQSTSRVAIGATTAGAKPGTRR